MNNENINPNYKGRFLRSIVADYNLDRLDFDEGTVLVQETYKVKVYFQLKFDYTYYNEWADKSRLFSRTSRNAPMEILLGSAIDGVRGFIPSAQKFCLAQHVRVPVDGELDWYEKQSIV